VEYQRATGAFWTKSPQRDPLRFGVIGRPAVTILLERVKVLKSRNQSERVVEYSALRRP
jgi:hypothetical protein